MSEHKLTGLTEGPLTAQQSFKRETRSERKPVDPIGSFGLAEDANLKWRSSMEDDSMFAVFSEIGGNIAFTYIGIVDGFGGKTAAQIAKIAIPNYFSYQLELGKPIEEALTEAYRLTDQEIKKQTKSGTVAVTVFIMGNNLVVANAGDAMAVLARNGEAKILTTIHNPENERERLENMGVVFVKGRPAITKALEEGKTAVSIWEDYSRIYKGNAEIDVARALGGRGWEGVIIPDPDIREVALTPGDTDLILASDGLWDVVSPEKAIEISRKYPYANQAAEALKEEALKRGSTDNITVCVIKFDPEKIKENAELLNAAPTTPSESS